MTYRYTLHRTVTPTLGDTDRGLLVWIMLNPSTADDDVDDPTIRRVKQFTADAGYSELHVVNLFARRCTRPVHLFDAGDPVGPRNNEVIREALDMADGVVEAYGAWSPSWRDRLLPRRDIFVCNELVTRQRTSMCLWPRHPLYVAKSQPLVEYRTPTVVWA